MREIGKRKRKEKEERERGKGKRKEKEERERGKNLTRRYKKKDVATKRGAEDFQSFR